MNKERIPAEPISHEFLFDEIASALGEKTAGPSRPQNAMHIFWPAKEASGDSRAVSDIRNDAERISAGIKKTSLRVRPIIPRQECRLCGGMASLKSYSGKKC